MISLFPLGKSIIIRAMNIEVKEFTGAAVQRAIDAAAAAGGGRVALEPGVYPCATINLRSNVELHIPGGATLLGSANPGDYEDFDDPRLGGVSPEGSRKVLLACRDAENVAVTGDGLIDGQGPLFYDRDVPPGAFFAKPPRPRTRMVQFLKCRNVRFEGVTFKDSPGWTFWLVDCEDVHVRGIRIDGCQQMINNDGIDIDSCRRVTVSDSFLRTGDDCIILRAIRRCADEPSVCEHVVVSNCVLDSRCQAIRVGCPSDDVIRHCQFSNIVCRSNNGVFCENPTRYLRKNCTGRLAVSDIRFEHFDLECKGYPVRVNVEDGIGLRAVERLEFRDFRIRAGAPVFLSGNAASILRDIALRDFSGVVAGETPVVARQVERLRLDGVELTATGAAPAALNRAKSDSWETRF